MSAFQRFSVWLVMLFSFSVSWWQREEGLIQQFSLWPKPEENKWFLRPGFGVALGGLGVALGWLWGSYQLAINRPWGGFDVALGGFGFVQPSF